VTVLTVESDIAVEEQGEEERVGKKNHVATGVLEEEHRRPAVREGAEGYTDATPHHQRPPPSPLPQAPAEPLTMPPVAGCTSTSHCLHALLCWPAATQGHPLASPIKKLSNMCIDYRWIWTVQIGYVLKSNSLKTRK
jgi:hypothetical protein